MKLTNPSQLVGSWTLESFEIEDLEKAKHPWGRDAQGLLIYAETGHMSVSINKAVEKESENEFEIFSIRSCFTRELTKSKEI